MRALVFGGSGFIGSHLVDYLLENSWEVINYDRLYYQPKVNLTNYEFVLMDITQKLMWEGIYTDFTSVDVVFYLSGISGIQDCLNNPLEAVNINIASVVNLLETVKNYPKLKLVFSSSIYVNNNISGVYGITKRACEDLIKFYHEQHDLQYLIFRVGTVYGPRANSHNSISKLIKEALKTKIISYYGTGNEVREYIHVKDVAKSLVELSEKKVNEIYEITGSHPTKAKHMIFTILELLGPEYVVQFRGEKVFNHYCTTPYRYSSDLVKRYISDTYYSFGSGLLEVIEEISKKGDINEI